MKGLILDLCYVQKDIAQFSYVWEFPCDALRVLLFHDEYSD